MWEPVYMIAQNSLINYRLGKIIETDRLEIYKGLIAYPGDLYELHKGEMPIDISLETVNTSSDLLTSNVLPAPSDP